MAALVLMVLVMPLSAVVVPLLGLPTAQATTLFAVLAGFPDLFLIVADLLTGNGGFQILHTLSQKRFAGGR